MEQFLPSNFTLANRFIIEKVIGQGGFGITYKVLDTKRQIPRCVKELFVTGSSSRNPDQTVFSQSLQGFSFGDMVIRFIEEAQTLALFNHPNIVDVRGVFQENGTAYMVLEFLKGISVGSFLKENGRFSIEDTLFIMFQIIEALKLVHGNSLLHRDIKPDNILLTEDGRAVLIDFGSARHYAGNSSESQTAIVSAGYAPIEQYSEISNKSSALDIYALGATMYHMLSGYKPMPSTERMSAELPKLHVINPDIDIVLSSIVMLCMEQKPQERIQSAEELEEILKDYSKKIYF